ncbi:MAG: HD domain-containing protein, partial [Betaproteobacteria bacterium]|nr:HD domain-containing protein [Betaproteobacteria bacterium]
RMHDNEIVQNASLTALAMLAEIRDTDTGNHIYRTQGYVEVLGKALLSRPELAGELTLERLTLLVKAAPLHDIGKVGIPDKVLLKPGRLSEEEFAIMRTHATIGSDAIGLAMARVQEADSSIYRGDSTPLAFLDVARQIARSHHERWDGSGYPDRLQGRAIPLPARIMALADVFDALISRRIYKDPLALEEAARIIIAEKGRHFDPVIVDAFQEVREQFQAIAQRFADV